MPNTKRLTAALTQLHRFTTVTTMEDIQKIETIVKDKLQALYIDQRKTCSEIAEMLSCSTSTIRQYLIQYNVARNHKQRKYELAKHIPFSQRQKEILVGTLLGDGCIERHGPSYRLLMSHCDKQKDLLFWKKDQLSQYVNCARQYISKKDNKKSWKFNSIVHGEFKTYYNLFYQNGTKTIIESLSNYITPLSLAVWYFDDGTLHNKKSVRISTEGYSENENYILSKIIMDKFGLLSKVAKHKKKEKEYYYLSMKRDASEQFFKLTEPYVIDCMKYKFGKGEL